MGGVDGLSGVQPTNTTSILSGALPKDSSAEFHGQPTKSLPAGGEAGLKAFITRPSAPVSVEPRSVGEILSEHKGSGGFFRVEGKTLIVGAGKYETIEECRSRVEQLVNQEQQRVNDATPWFQKPKSIYTDAIIYGPQQDIIRDGKVVGQDRRNPITLSFGNEGGSAFVKAVEATKQAIAKAGDAIKGVGEKSSDLKKNIPTYKELASLKGDISDIVKDELNAPARALGQLASLQTRQIAKEYGADVVEGIGYVTTGIGGATYTDALGNQRKATQEDLREARETVKLATEGIKTGTVRFSLFSKPEFISPDGSTRLATQAEIQEATSLGR